MSSLARAAGARHLWLAILCAAAPSAASEVADGAWRQLPPPAWLIWHSAVYDPVGDRMLVFGGMDGVRERDDLWELPLGPGGEWRKLQPAGTGPPAVRDQRAVYDPVRRCMWLFGGRNLRAGRYYDRVWCLSLADPMQWS